MQFSRLLNLRRYTSEILALAFALLAPNALVLAQKVPASTGTLDRVRQTRTLRLGYYADAGPFSYQDQAGKPAGFAIALCQEIANDVKTEVGEPLAVDFVLVSGTDRFAAVQQGTIDMLCGPSVETLTRRNEISYSIPIFPAGLGALVRADGPAQVREILSGHEPPYRPMWRGSVGLALQKRTFSAVKGTTGLSWLNGKIEEFKIDARVVPVESHDEGVEQVLHRNSDVLFGERSILLDAKRRNASGADLLVLDRLFTYEPFALALARGDEDFRVLVDRSLSRLIRSGQTQSLYRKFFGEPDTSTLTFFRMSALPE